MEKDYKKMYEDAFERARIMHEQGMSAERLEYIFPQLKESEDEKIRRGLIKGLSAMRDIHKHQTFSDDAINIDNAIAWLEKQGDRYIDCSQNHQYNSYPNGCIVFEDFNGGEGFYKLHLDYLNKKQVEDVEGLVRMWNTESNSLNNENIRACIGMCLTDADEQRFKNYNTNLKECIAWLDKQYEQLQQEWSKEDSERLLRIHQFIWANRKGDTDEIYQQEQDADWLMTLTPNNWKPSEQNIKDLKWCAELFKDKMGVGFHRLQVFIDELKKL